MILGKGASNTVFQKQLHCYYTKTNKGIPRGSVVKNLPAMPGTPVQSQSQEDPLEKGMATHSSILAWEIPWTEEPGRLQFMGSKRIKHNPVTQFSSVAQSCLTLWPHGLQHASLLCPSPTPGVDSNSYPLNWWCHPTISSSIVPFSSHLQTFPASGSFPVSQLFAWGGQSTGVSASISVLPVNT